MTNEHLLDLNALRSQQGAGLQLEDGFYPWVILGPIETAQYMDLQEKIQDIGERNTRRLSIEDASELVAVMRDQLTLILPSASAEVLNAIPDSEVDTILRFFENARLEDQGDLLEEAVEKAEKQATSLERMKKSGERMDSSATAIDDLNKRMRRRRTGDE